MKTKCVIVKAAGRRIDPWNAAWYDLPHQKIVRDYFNTGDITVYDGTLKLLRFSDSIKINIDEPVDQDLASYIRQNFDYIALRPSNYLHEEMQWGQFPAWLEALELPVICLGIGAQATRRHAIKLTGDNQRVWQMISERAASIGVRGPYSASLLNDNGIANAEIVGCPTMFRHRRPDIELRHKQVDGSSRLAFSLRRETGDNYTDDADAFLTTQKRIIAQIDRRFDLTITLHGETEEKAYYYQDRTEIPVARQRLIDSGWLDPVYGPILEKLYTSNLFFTLSPSHYDEFIATMDFAVGYRVHGVLPALAAGVPSVLLRYDARSEELAETLHVPIMDPLDFIKTAPEDVFAAERFAEFERQFPSGYQAMKTFLERNDVAHRM
jgi:hypothetical protein